MLGNVRRMVIISMESGLKNEHAKIVTENFEGKYAPPQEGGEMDISITSPTVLW